MVLLAIWAQALDLHSFCLKNHCQVTANSLLVSCCGLFFSQNLLPPNVHLNRRGGGKAAAKSKALNKFSKLNIRWLPSTELKGLLPKYPFPNSPSLRCLKNPKPINSKKGHFLMQKRYRHHFFCCAYHSMSGKLDPKAEDVSF